MHTELLVEAMKGDIEYLTKHLNKWQRSHEKTVLDLICLYSLINQIQEHKDCTDDLFNLVEQAKHKIDYE